MQVDPVGPMTVCNNMAGIWGGNLGGNGIQAPPTGKFPPPILVFEL